ncbi:hypothetical protein N7490_006847 [Penicillium lividum]|nr:hypothetical protein N7490_006847 [Penicillium lividum]
MEPRQLQPPAKDIRTEIKELLPLLEIEEDASGNKKYSGDALSGLISRMKAALSINETWEGRLRFWSKRTKLDIGDAAYLIPILNEIEVNGWFLKAGWFVKVNNDPVVGAGATTLVITPH